MTALFRAFSDLNARLRKLIIYYYGLYLGLLYCVLFYLITSIILEMEPFIDAYFQPAIHQFVVSYMGLFCWAWLSIGVGIVVTWRFSKSEPKMPKYLLRIAAIVVPLTIYFMSAPMVNLALKVIRYLSA